LFLALKTPGDNENVSGNVNVSALVSAPSSIKITKVIFKSEGGISSTMLAGDAGLYTYQWDTTKLNEGTNKYTITLETSDGKNLSKNASVFVKNSKTDISIISPTYDANIQGTYAVKAKISNKAEQVKDVTLNIGDKVVPMLYDKTEDLYIANVDTTKITDGTYSFFIKATDSTAVIESFVDAMINNKGFSTGIVKANGSNFEVDGKQFNYSGWNAYSYPFSDGVTIGSNTSKVSWDNTGKKVELYVPQGTNIPFEQYVDSCMLEARKTGLNVVRTWGFNSDVSQAHSFYKVDANGVWQFNEDEFKRFDYIMDSAKKHGVRVIVVFDNYWTAYGGITAETAHVGLPNALDFFYDLKAKQLYENYISNFVKRINTVNNIAYKEDPTVFSWELMNEPRMDYNQDTSADHSLFDPTGARLKSWASTEAKFIKSLDSKHMVSLGAEGVGQMVHGQAYGGDQSGYGSNPVKNVMSAEGIDFTTFHPYVNTIYSAYNLEQTKEFIQNFVKESKEIGKPAVMEEFGIQREDNPADIADFSNQKTNVLDSNWNELRDTWNKVMLATFRRAGGDGTNIWQFSVYGGIDNSFDVVAYAPEDLASIYHKSVDILAEESKLMQITNSNMFTDVLGGQYKQSINEVAYAGLMNGSNGKFNPEGSVSTNDIIEILEKLNISTEGLLSNDGDKKITRIQAIELINKALRPTPVDLNSLKSEKYPNLDMRFNDISSLSADQVNALRSMFVALIIDDGSDGTNFRPNNNLTRAELAQMMSRVTDFLTYSIKATKVDLAVTSKTMNVKDNVVLVATVSPANATSKAVTWKSTNEKVATVDKNGKVTAVGAGTADIIVTTVDGAYTSKCIVTVNEVVEEAIKVTKVDLDVTSKTLNIKDTVVLVATVSPANATNKTITWKSTNEKVATVDKNGKVTAVGAGTADIIVITVDGAYTSKCIVTVNAIVDNPGTIPVDNPGTTPVTDPVSVVIFNNATDGVQVIINAIKNDTTGQINIDASNNSKIAKSIFEAIKGKNINIVIKAGLITWTFNGKDIKSPMDLDVSLKTPSQSLVDKINNKVKQLTGGSKKTFCFSFNHDGPLPGIATVKLFMGKDWANKTVILRRYFSSKDTIENVLNQGNLKVDGQGYVTFRLDHCSDYFITEANANLPQTGSAVDMQSLIIVGLIMIIGGVALSFKRRKKI